jgi:hypothetical protein
MVDTHYAHRRSTFLKYCQRYGALPAQRRPCSSSPTDTMPLSAGVNDGTESRSAFLRVLDEGGMIWTARRRYPSLDAALADAEAGVSRWMKDQLEITDAALPGG